MINEGNFIVRLSGIKAGFYYIDYAGIYKIAELANITDMEAHDIRVIYLDNGGEYDEEQEVFYFRDAEKAQEVVCEMLKCIKSDQKGKIICFTEEEVEYIKKALIDEGADTVHLKNTIKDDIFRKLNT